jgi:hypothetical protein
MTRSTANRLQQQHETLYTILEHQGPQDLLRRPAPDTWSLLENVAHLAAYQQVFAKRVARILTEDNPSFAAYIGDQDPNFLAARDLPLEDLLTDLSADRLYLHDWIISLDPLQLAREATHPKYGTRTLSLWTEFFLLHKAHHLFTMWKLLENRT